jgi:replication factor C subunit 3/5
MCETCKVQQYPFDPNQNVDDPDWLTFVKQTALKIIEEQSPKRLLDIRSRLYELLAHCIPPEVIFRSLADELVKHCDGNLQKKVVQAAANYEHKLQLGSRPIYYLEAFVARFMALYKGFIQDAIMDFDDFDFDES